MLHNTVKKGMHSLVEMLIALYNDQPFSKELSQPLMPQLVPRAST